MYIYIYINVKKKIKTKIIHIQIFKYPSAYLDNFSSINGSIIIFIYL